jgi:hypothetical protein
MILRNERIFDLQPGKPTEIPIRRPEFLHSMSSAKGGDSGVVNEGTGNQTALKGGFQCRPILLEFEVKRPVVSPIIAPSGNVQVQVGMTK